MEQEEKKELEQSQGGALDEAIPGGAEGMRDRQSRNRSPRRS